MEVVGHKTRPLCIVLGHFVYCCGSARLVQRRKPDHWLVDGGVARWEAQLELLCGLQALSVRSRNPLGLAIE